MLQPLQKLPFETLPEPIRDWLTSDRATGIIISINQRENLVDEDIKIIPRLITQLVTGEVHPRNFTAELK